MVSEISAKLTADTVEFKASLNDAANEAGRFGTTLSGKLKDKLTGMRDISTALATAIGLDYRNIADNVARFITGMTEEAEAALKNIAELSQQIADINIKTMRSGNSDAQQYAQLLKDQARLIAEIEDRKGRVRTTEIATWDALRGVQKVTVELAQTEEEREEIKKREKALAEVSAQIKERELKATKETAEQQDKNVKASIEYNQKEVDGQLAVMEGADKIKKLKQTILDIQGAINTAALTEEQKEVLRVNLQARKNELAKEEGAVKKQMADNDRKNADATIDSQRKIADAKREALSDEMQTVAIKKEIHGWELAIAYQMENHLDASESIKRADELRAKLREKEKDQAKKIADDKADFLKREVEIQKILKDGVGALTEEDRKRLIELAGQNSILQEQIKIIDDLTQQFTGFKTTITSVGDPYAEQSTAALEGTLARLRTQLDRAQNEFAGSQYGFYSPTVSPVIGAYATQVRQIEEVLARRREISGFAARYGEDAARGRYGDTATDNALRELRDTSTRTAQTLENIERRLNNSGLFPKF